jgi:hypothetical protein
LGAKELDKAYIAGFDGCKVTPTDNPRNYALEVHIGITITLIGDNVLPLQLQSRAKNFLEIIERLVL